MKLPKLLIKKIKIESGRRILVTSDIHGHLSYLKKLLEKAEFCDNDILVIVGDIIEKGPESLKTLRYVMELCEKGNVISLLGNVDAWRLCMIDGINADSVHGFYDYLVHTRAWYETSFFDELVNELGYSIDCPDDILKSQEKVINHFQKEFEFLANLQTVVETQNYIFVHGGLFEKEVDDNLNKNYFDLLRFGNFLNTEICFDKYVVAGHTPVTLYGEKVAQSNPIIDRNKKIIAIDGGCGIKEYGQLNLLIIPDINCDVDNVHYISNDDLPLFRALTPQTESSDSINIRWSDNEIEILAKDDDFYHIRHKRTGRTTRVHSPYVYDNNHCHDYTDYILPVSSGDLLSLVKKMPKGYYVKKNGVTGWYYGELEKV